MGLILGKNAASPLPQAQDGQRKRGRPRLTPEQIEQRQKAKELKAAEVKAVQETEKPQAEEAPKPAKPSKPKMSPKDLRKKMQDYFDSCHTDYDWEALLDEFVELAETMKVHPTWSNHEKKFRSIALKATTGDVFPDEAGMRIFLSMDHAEYRSYKEDKDYESVFNWAQDMRESWASRRLAAEPKAAQAFLNILKQEANGGWVDRKQESGEQTLTVKAAGVGGMEAFK